MKRDASLAKAKMLRTRLGWCELIASQLEGEADRQTIHEEALADRAAAGRVRRLGHNLGIQACELEAEARQKTR